MPYAVALIPARAGSKRVIDKNIRPLAGHPVMAYTIAATRASGIFDAVVLSTDSEHYARIGRHYGAEVPFMRPASMAGDTSPDIEWVEFTLRRLVNEGRSFEVFSILRPTSPFRLPETIKRAWTAFQAQPDADSLRAVEKCKQHPGKMWLMRGSLIEPLFTPELQKQRFGQAEGKTPWHSSQYQSLPPVYVQNASLEIARSRVALQDGTIAGEKVIPFLTENYEGFDVNHPYDWVFAEELVRTGEARLPVVEELPFR